MNGFSKFLKGQTALELAIFGAVFTFVFAAMIRSAVNNNFTQAENLKAMRLALQKSFESSTSSFDNNAGDISRATASLLFIEDRTSPDANKFGSLQRTPYLVSSTATFSRTLFKPMDYGDIEDIPIFDVFVNGHHFTFTTAAFKEVDISTDPGGFGPGNTPRWSPTCNGIGAGCQRLYKIVVNGEATLNASDPDTTDPSYCSVDPCQCAGSGGNACTYTCKVEFANCLGIPPPTGPGDIAWVTPPPYPGQCFNPPGFIPPFYDSTDEQYGQCIQACKDSFDACINAIPNFTLTTNERFDLNWDGSVDVAAPERPQFSWQWTMFYANTVDINLQEGKNSYADVDGDRREEQILEMYDNTGRHYTTFDVNQNRRNQGLRSPIHRVRVIDQQDGDVDLTETPGKPQGGLRDDMQMFTYTRDGTYLRVLEGRLVDPTTNKFVRSVQKRDQVDIIQRSFQMSTDTGRFCGNGSGAWWDVADHAPNTTLNPDVEACNNCFDAANIYKTCFDETSLLLWIRSRIEDRRGRHWITDVSGPVQ